MERPAATRSAIWDYPLTDTRQRRLIEAMRPRQDGRAAAAFTVDELSEAILDQIRVRPGTEWLLAEPPDSKTRAIAGKMQLEAATRIAVGTEWHSGRALAAMHGGDPRLVVGRLGRWVRQGRLFGLFCRNTRVYPKYAFDPEGEPLPGLRDVISCFGGAQSIALAAWFESPSARLDGLRPREALKDQSAAVLVAAQRNVTGLEVG